MRHFLIAFAAAGLAAAPAHAVILSPGSNALAGTTVAQRPELARTQVSPTLVTSFSFQGDAGPLSGQVTSEVSRSDVDGSLIFSWTITSSADSDDLIRQFRLAGFGTDPLDGDYRLDGLGVVGPSSAFLFASGGVNFQFGSDPIGAGERTYSMFLRSTSATGYDDQGSFDLTTTSRASGLYATYRPIFGTPTAPVPEPASWAMMIAGFGLVGLARRRQRRLPIATA